MLGALLGAVPGPAKPRRVRDRVSLLRGVGGQPAVRAGFHHRLAAGLHDVSMRAEILARTVITAAMLEDCTSRKERREATKRHSNDLESESPR